MDDLDVQVENNQLTIRGHQGETPEDEQKVYLYRGIAARQFQRSFVLADGIEVEDAYLDNGLLHIEMHRIEPESTARKIAIKSPAKVTNGHKSTRQAIEVEGKESDES